MPQTFKSCKFHKFGNLKKDLCKNFFGVIIMNIYQNWSSHHNLSTHLTLIELLILQGLFCFINLQFRCTVSSQSHSKLLFQILDQLLLIGFQFPSLVFRNQHSQFLLRLLWNNCHRMNRYHGSRSFPLDQYRMWNREYKLECWPNHRLCFPLIYCLLVRT